MIGETVSRYLILNVLGEGGMGTVYVAEDTLLKRRVAIKFLTTDSRKQHYRARFRREVLSASGLSHPNIATIHDYGETVDGVPFIVMELVEGQSLADLMRQGLSISRVLEIIDGVCRALAEAHANKIIHRDIKPTNIAINKRGEVKVLDFGLAKQINDDAGNGSDPANDIQALLATQTRENTTIGTPMYMSPEQSTGLKIDRRSDLFSLGAVLYECITGQAAFYGQTIHEVRDRVLHHNPPKPSRINPNVPRELDHIALKALAKNPKDRYQSIEELLTELSSLRERLRGANHVVVRVPPSNRGLRSSLLSAISNQLRRPSLMAASFVVCLAATLLVAWAGWWWFQRPTAHSFECTEAMQRGTKALRDGTYDRGLKAFEQAVSVCDGLPLAHARLAETLAEFEYMDRAGKELLRVRQPDPDDTSIESLSLQAIRLSLTGDPRGAAAVYEKIVQQSKEREASATAHVDLGRAYERDGFTRKAIESYSKALEIDPKQTAAAMRLGVIYARRQDTKSTELALAQFAKAESRYASTNDAEGLGEVSYQRGVMYTTRREVIKAREQLDRAVANARAIGNKYLEIKSRLQLSNLLCVEGETDAARQYANEALEFAKNNNLEVLTVNGLVTMGNTFIPINLGRAEEFLRRALDVADYYGTRRSKARALLALASMESQRHTRPDKIRAYVERALPIVKEDGYRKFETQAQELLGHASVQWGDYASARAAFERQLELAMEYDDNDQASRAYQGRGITLLAQEDYTGALSDFDRNLETARKIGLKPNIAHALSNRGNVLWRLGRYEEAEQVLAESLQIAEHAQKPDQELLAHLRLTNAKLALSRGRYKIAQAEGLAALERAGDQFEAVAIEARSTIGQAQTLSGNTKEGAKTCAEAVEIARGLGTPPLLSAALLALAATELESDSAANALLHALEARETFKHSGQLESEWRALSIAAAGLRVHGNQISAQAYTAEASQLLAGMEQRLSVEAYKRYLQRPDVQRAHKQLDLETSD